MPPQKRGSKAPNQVFDEDEKLYRRVPPTCLSPLGEVVPSNIRCSFGDYINKSPSVLRSKYGTAADVIHNDCARGSDVSDHLVFYLIVKELPKSIESGDRVTYDFYPFHDPEDDCYGHSVIACKKSSGPHGTYDKPTQGVRNKLKAQFVSAFQKHRVALLIEDDK